MIDNVKAYWEKVEKIDLDALYEFKDEWDNDGKLEIKWIAFKLLDSDKERSNIKEKIVQSIAQGKIRVYEPERKGRND